jgi:transposase InsO family protein
MRYYITPTEERQRGLNRHHFLKNRDFYFFLRKPLVLLDQYQRWRKIAKTLKLSREACKRLEWIIYYETEKYKLYYHPQKVAKIRRKRQRAQKKKRITELKQKKVSGFLLCLDVIVIYWNKYKRYIFTAIDRFSKVAFARMYTTRSSYNARDFLARLHFLLGGQIDNIQHDEGSEFKKYFSQECQKLNISEWFSRIKTPQDNATNERFNRTLKEEFIQLNSFMLNAKEFNQSLTEWLVEYNFKRPHQALGYMPPI